MARGLDARREVIDLASLRHGLAVDDHVDLDAEDDGLLPVHGVGHLEDLDDAARVAGGDGVAIGRVHL